MYESLVCWYKHSIENTLFETYGYLEAGGIMCEADIKKVAQGISKMWHYTPFFFGSRNFIYPGKVHSLVYKLLPSFWVLQYSVVL